jgi:hypothetical protein
MDTFHPSLSTKVFNGTIFRKLGSFYFAGNFKCPAYGSGNISTTMFLVSSTETPCTTDFIMFVLDWTIP